ncbi:MAG: ExsB family transcriptional regulator [Anaerolineae bacterium]|nr:ExsB family transcriptional regulator [Anaerolineae bacterium]
MTIQEITLEKLNTERFIAQQVQAISAAVGDGLAINALSGGVDSSTVTLLAHKALNDQLLTVFVENGIMRKGEPRRVVERFKALGVPAQLINAREDFFAALKGLIDPEEKREAITQTFYKTVFGELVRESGAKFLLHGTILTDVDETVAGIKRQHNILTQLGIDTEEMYGYQVIEPLLQLRKPAVRAVAKALGLSEEVYNRMPFPGPALAARIIGEVTPERAEIVREATAIVEEELANTGAFQYLAILHQDKVTGMRDGKRDYGLQIEVRCWESADARTGSPTRLPFDTLERLADRITSEVPGVVSVTYNITKKPPSTIEAV